MKLMIIVEFSKILEWTGQLTLKVEVTKWDKQIIDFLEILKNKEDKIKNIFKKKVVKIYQ